MNTITFHGNVVRDAVVRDAGDFKVLEVSVADNVGFGDKQVTNFFKVQKFQKTDPSKLAELLVKGKPVFVSGEFKAVPYTDKNGAEKVSFEVNANTINLIGSSGSSDSSTSRSAQTPAKSATPKKSTPARQAESSGEDDMPF